MKVRVTIKICTNKWQGWGFKIAIWVIEADSFTWKALYHQSKKRRIGKDKRMSLKFLLNINCWAWVFTAKFTNWISSVASHKSASLMWEMKFHHEMVVFTNLMLIFSIYVVIQRIKYWSEMCWSVARQDTMSEFDTFTIHTYKSLSRWRVFFDFGSGVDWK